MKKIILSVLLMFWGVSIFAQDPWTDRFEAYQKIRSNAKLYVHFDKNVYAENETVWFTAYLIDNRHIDKHHILSVSMIRESDNKVVLEDRFEMKKGLTFGSMFIPDSVPTGNYRFLAITDLQVNGEPEAAFTQYITLKSVAEPPFKTRMNILGVNDNTYKVAVYSTTTDNLFFNKPADVTYTYGNVHKTVKTDNSGRALIEIDYQKDLNDPTLYVKVLYGKDSTYVNMPLKDPKNIVDVKFYPEGGHIVAGLTNHVGWEIKDGNKRPVAMVGYVLKNDIPIDTVRSNVYGIGKFALLAEPGANYTLRFTGNKNFQDISFALPSAIADGIALHIPEAVVKDTLVFDLQANKSQQLGIRLHNYKTSYIYTKIDVQSGKKTWRIPVSRLPKGLVAFTITDTDEKPLAERLFFAHYDNEEKVNLSTGKNKYNTREKVSLKLNPKNINSQAIVSIAVVHDSRIEAGKMTDIENYAYLQNELVALPVQTDGSIYRQKNYMEDILLIKGWRKYSWNELANISGKDTNPIYSNLRYTGTVSRGKKIVSEIVHVGVMDGKNIHMIQTDDKGRFDFNTPELYAETGRKLFMFVNNDKKGTYQLAVQNQLLETGKKLALLPSMETKPPLQPQADNSDLFFKAGEKSIRIDEVLVTRAQAKGALGPNACGDYVCIYNVLNCRVHYGDPRNTSPIAGKTYNSGRKKKVVYAGCSITDKSMFFKAEGIHLAKEYYVEEYDDPQEPAFHSTVYWNHALLLNKNKEVTIDFYTGDIVGKYRIIVQGIGQDEVIYGQQVFEVTDR